MKNNNNRNILKTKQGKDLNLLANITDYVFNQLQNKTGRTISYEEEQLWKKQFDKQIMLKIDEFLTELSEETNINYVKPVFIEEIENLD